MYICSRYIKSECVILSKYTRRANSISLQECNPNWRASDTQACVVTRIESTWCDIRELCLLRVCILVNAFATHFMRNRLVNIFSRKGYSSRIPLSAVLLAMRITQSPLLLSFSRPDAVPSVSTWFRALSSRGEIQFLIHFRNIRETQIAVNAQ